MSKPISGTFPAALILSVTLPGCSAETSAPDPTTEATDSIMETEATPRWTVVIGPPRGWLLVYPRTPYDTVVVRESYRQGDREGISIGSLSSNELCKHGGPLKLPPETGKPGVDAYRDAWLTDTSMHDRYISDTRSMGPRTIDGEYVAGSAYTVTTRKGKIHACRFWMVGRPEGLWDFYVCSAPGETDIAPELLAAFETTRWVDTPPTFSHSKAEDLNYPC